MLNFSARILFISLVFAFGALPLGPALAAAISVYKTPACGCCAAWTAYIANEGLDVSIYDVSSSQLTALKQQNAITPELASCHTAFIDGYVVEGHVPLEDINRLRSKKLNARGLVVPAMPAGAPGMEVPGFSEPYETLLLKKDGTVTIFARHN